MSLELKRLCHVVATVINDRDFNYQSPQARDLVDEHIASDWYGRLDDMPYTINFDEQTEAWRQMTEEYPDLYFDLIEIDCDVHKDQRTAQVVMRSSMTGRSGMRLQGVCEMRWMFRGGKWVWQMHNAMRGLNYEGWA